MNAALSNHTASLMTSGDVLSPSLVSLSTQTLDPAQEAFTRRSKASERAGYRLGRFVARVGRGTQHPAADPGTRPARQTAVSSSVSAVKPAADAAARRAVISRAGNSSGMGNDTPRARCDSGLPRGVEGAVSSPGPAGPVAAASPSPTPRHRAAAALDLAHRTPLIGIGLRACVGEHAAEIVLLGAGITSVLIVGDSSALSAIGSAAFDILNSLIHFGLSLFVGPLWAELVIAGLGLATYLFFRTHRRQPSLQQAY
jgi:hypothetical protein